MKIESLFSGFEGCHLYIADEVLIEALAYQGGF
jgi:hypothetical protein